MFFDQGLCLFHTKPENQEQLFRSMYKELYQAGCVKASYIDGITARESEYPTGFHTPILLMLISLKSVLHHWMNRLSFKI